MRSEEKQTLRAEMEEYFTVHGWKWETLTAYRERNSYFQYGPIRLLKPSIKVEH